MFVIPRSSGAVLAPGRSIGSPAGMHSTHTHTHTHTHTIALISSGEKTAISLKVGD